MRAIQFKDVKRLGFKISTEHDSVYESQYGFPYKIITYKLKKYILLDWDQVTGKCELLICDSESTILLRQDVPNLEKLIKIIETFKKQKVEKLEEPKELKDLIIDSENELETNSQDYNSIRNAC